MVHGCLGGRLDFGVRAPVDSAGDFDSSASCLPSARLGGGSDGVGVEIEAGTSRVLASPSRLSFSLRSFFSLLFNFSLSAFSGGLLPFNLGSSMGLIGAGPVPAASGGVDALALFSSTL